MISSNNNNNPIQELFQGVCQRFGWSCELVEEKKPRGAEEGTSLWRCAVVVQRDDRRTFQGPSKRNVAQAALDDLQGAIDVQKLKRIVELTDIYNTPIALYESTNPKIWKRFWERPPSVVGIDTEGNQLIPPVLLQIGTPDYCILEVRNNQSQTVSQNVQRLLRDTEITKVFCDSFAHYDKKCLGILNDVKDRDWTTGHIVDLEALCSIPLGPSKTARGLNKIASLLLPELSNVQFPKATASRRYKSVHRFVKIQQGRLPPLRSVRDLTQTEQQYAALDA